MKKVCEKRKTSSGCILPAYSAEQNTVTVISVRIAKNIGKTECF